jgi:hypothetical protein
MYRFDTVSNLGGGTVSESAINSPLFSNQALGTYFPAITPFAVTERRLTFCGGTVSPTCDSRRKIRARDFFWGDLSGDDYFESHRVGMVKDRTNRLRCCHLQLFAIVFADQD